MASAKKSRSKRRVPRPEGQLRQSQLITTFGPGSMVDLVDRAVVIGGLEHWGYGPHAEGEPLDDARLRRALIPRLKALHPDLDLARDHYFRKPPEGDLHDPYPNVGVRALEFPRWFVCQGCQRLARAGDAFAEPKGGRYRHDCAPNKRSHAIPVRFVAACRRGHLTDFPWVNFVHLAREGGPCDRWELYLHEGATGDFGKIIVECRNCGSRAPMNRASAAFPFDCYGDRPWLGGRAVSDECDQKLELLVRTGSDAYFSQVVSALRLPEPEPDPLRRRIREKKLWDVVKDAKDEAAIQTLLGIIGFLRESLDGHSAAAIARAVQQEREAEAGVSERPLRSAEFERMTSAPVEQPGVVPDPDVEFAAYTVPNNRVDLPKGVASLIVVPELREVRVQVSFSRFDSVSADLQGEYDFEQFRVKPAPLTMPGGNEKWLPAAEVRGEGIFVQLDEAAVQAWEKLPTVVERG